MSSSPEDLYWVKIVGLSPELTEDDIAAHFQSARCGSGLVRTLVYLGQHKTAAIIGIEGMDANGAEKLTKGSHTIAGIKLRVTKGEVPSTSQLKQAITYPSTYSTPPLQPPSHVMPPPVTQSVRPVPRPRTKKPTSSLRTDEVSVLSVAAQGLSLATAVGQAEDSVRDRSRPDSVPVDAGSPIQTSFHSQSTPLRTESITSASLTPMSPVVRVVGVLPEWDQDMLSLAFDDEDEGGGEIEENGIHISGNEALITFKDPEVAQRVTQKESWQICEVQVKVFPFQHKHDGAQGMVEKCSPDTTIVLEGIPEDVDEDHLKFYLDKVTGLDEGEEFALYHKETVAVMVLLGKAVESLDATVMRILSAKKQLKGTKLKASRLTPVLSVLVTRISNEACKEDKLKLYFKNKKKSGGGRLQGVEVRAKGEAIVTFQEPEGVEGVLARNHTGQLGDEVELQVYHPILSLWSGTVDQPKRAKTEKKSAIFHELPKAWYEHIRQKSNLMQVVNDQLSDMKLSAKAKLDASKAVVCIEPTAGSEFDEEWSSQCTDILRQTLSTITEASVQIPEDVAGKVFPVILANVSHPNVSITMSDNQDHVSIIGNHHDADHLKEIVERIIHSNLDTMKDVPLPVSVLVFSDQCIRQRLETEHPNVIFRVSLPEGMMHISGKAAGCEKFLTQVESLQPVEVVPKLSKEVVQLLFMPNGKQLLQSKLVQHEAVSYFFTVEDGTIPHDDVTPMQSLHVVGPSLQALQGVANALEKCCTVTNLKVPDEFENTHRLESWAEMKRLIEKQYIALLIPAVEKRQIQLVCDAINVDVITREIVSFIERECFAEECIPVERGQWEHMNEVSSKDWIKESCLIESSGIHYKFPQVQDDVLIVRLKGEATPVRKHAAAIKAIIGNIVKEKIEVARPGTVKHFLSEKGILELKGVGYTRKAVVEVSTLDEEKEEAVLMEQAAQPSHRTVCSGVIAGNKRVEIMVGDLTEYPVDVIVNAANTKLQHGGGLAGLICRKGGDIIQKESARHIARYGPLDVGQAVLMTGVGNLHCKAVVHAVGPVWQNGSQNEEAYLAKAVEGSLSKAQKYTSIGLPAISSGIYGVPLDVCARAMFTGISQFFQKNPKCNIKVIIMLHNDKYVGPFDNIVDQYLQNVSRLQRPASPTTTGSEEEQVHEELTVPTELSPTLGPRRPVFSLAQKMSNALVLQKGTLADQAVDVYVNTAASSLDLKHGAVANSLRAAGGPKLQEECTQYTQANGDVKEWQFATTRGHKLKCKHVIHTVGDNYSGQGGMAEKNMKTMIHEVMKECDRLKASSVAFPALGTGNLGFPDDVVADIMVTTINAYLEQQKGKTCVKKVVFVIFLDKTHNAFKKVMERGVVAPLLPQTQKMPSTIVLKQGALADQAVDVYVNTAASSLDLKHGAVANSLRAAGGPKLQEECTQYTQANGDVKEWHFATTRGHKLKCKHVIHTVGDNYVGQGGTSEKNMKIMIHNVMEECDRLKASSVAFPALGTGNLGFPDDVVANIMVTTVNAYLEQQKGKTCVKKVVFVIFLDKTHNAFKKVMGRGATASHLSLPGLQVQPTSRPVSDDEEFEFVQASEEAQQMLQEESTALHAFTCNNVTISIVHGDISTDDCEGLVNTTSEDLTLLDVGVQRALLQKGGQPLQDECRAAAMQHGNLTHGKVIVTGPGRAGGLKCKKILHIRAPNKPGGLVKTIGAVLQRANEEGLRSVALPAIGTGKHGFPAKHAAKHICEAIVSFSKGHQTTLSHIRIVLFQEDLFSEFAKYFEESGQEKGVIRSLLGAMGNIWGAVASAFSGSTPFSQEHGPSRSTKHAHAGISYPPGRGPLMRAHSYTESTVLVILVYAGSQEIVHDVVEHIKKLIDESCVTEEVQDARVDALSTAVERNWQDFAKQLHVKLSIDRAPFNKIKIQGDRVDVSTIKEAIMKHFFALEMEQKQITQAELMTSTIQWQWKDSQGQFQNYEPLVNLQIEEAHREGTARVVVTTEEGPKEIDLLNKTEFSQQPPFTNTEVRRRDLDQERQDYEREKQEGEKPKTWDPMPIDPKTGKEALCHVVDLTQASPEYKEVEQAFSRTMGVAGGFPSGMLTPYQGIVKIQRIQNQKLYSQYIARKRVIDKANPEGHKNEETLFHGCDGKVTNDINHEGLNRNFAGKNATALGRGVYFARDANYSASDTYTPRDANGHKHMYYARVLTGQYTKGDSTLLVPPPKDPSNPSVLHESVVNNVQNPSIFVVFQDAHVYPEYLITFQ